MPAENVAPHSRRLTGRIDTAGLRLGWSEAPGDSLLFGAPILQIIEMTLADPDAARTDITPFLVARDQSGSYLVSCRLPHNRLQESFLLEEIGFRFIDMAYQPEILLADTPNPATGLDVTPSDSADLPEILEIAGS